jgi:predicted lipoprotein with Yx(FWY)xxD motif
MRRALALSSALIVGVALAACGSSSSSTSSGSSAAQQPAAASASSSTTTAASSASSSTAAAAAPVLISTKHSKLGTILAVGPEHLTVYLFEADKRAGSTCTGACASAWPPVLGQPKATGSAVAADLGTITRSDGSKQVTYKGHPLYRFVKDKDDGDAYGEGLNAFGAGWYVLTPAGNKVDES